MHFFNDVNRDMEIPISEPSDMQLENYKRLLEIANKNDANDILLRAEIYRELGDFEKSLDLLESTIKAMPDNYLESAKHLILLCKNKDSRVMEILTREN
jgi:tetratricopeptide (TPR) repeat protein